MLAEILEGDVGEDVVGEEGVGAREEDLAAVARGADPSGAVDAQPDVASVRRGGLARV